MQPADLTGLYAFSPGSSTSLSLLFLLVVWDWCCYALFFLCYFCEAQSSGFLMLLRLNGNVHALVATLCQ